MTPSSQSFDPKNLSRALAEVGAVIDDDAGKPSPKPRPAMKPVGKRPAFLFSRVHPRLGGR